MFSRIIHIASILAVCSTTLAAQERTYAIQGTVSDDNGALLGAVVTYLHDGQEGTEYDITDSQGRFILRLNTSPSAKDSIRVSMLGYATLTMPAEISGNMNITLERRPLNINEVIIRGRKVNLSGDTVKYNVQSFAEVQDKSISDALKRMPGIEVHDNGDIYYNGESIGNMYVEGMDILNGRYSLLTKNLSARDVKTVEIIERHQPIKAIAEISPGAKPAINIVLRDQVRGKWIGSAKLSGGIASDPEALWDGNLFLMRVGLKWNSMNNIKTNNSGNDLSKELQANGMNSRSRKADNFISIGTSNAPLESHRVKFNTSALFNTSNLWKLKDDWKLNASVSYLFDRLESWNESATKYYFEDGIHAIEESEETMTRQHHLLARIEAEANKKDYYFSNVLTAKGEFADAIQRITGEFPNTQKARLPYFFASDDLKYIKKDGNNAFSVESLNDFSRYDQNLTVIRGENDVQRQTVGVTDFNTDTYISSDFTVADGMTVGITGGVEASVRTLTSHLNGIDTAGMGTLPLQNDVVAAFVRPYVTPNMKYYSKNWEIKLSVPAGWSRYWGADTDNFIYRVSGSVKYSPTPKFYIEALGTVSNSGLDIHDYYDGYILRNYRYLGTGSVNTAQDEYYSITGHINFKNPLNMIYADAVLGRYWNVFQTSVTQDFIGDYIVTGTEYAPSRGDRWYAMLSGSIGIYGINGKASAMVYYIHNSMTSIVQNGTRTPYISQTISFRPAFSGRFASWISMEYELAYSHYILSLPGTATSESKDNFSHTLSFNITPLENLDLKISAEHYFTMPTAEQTKNTVLLDASLAYRFKNGIEISLTARNLLNQRTYAYSVFNALQEFSCEYRIRPLNILAGVYFNF